MERQLVACQRLYNAMLMQRRMAYRDHGKSLSRFDQERQLADVRTMPEYASIYCHVLQDVARRVDLAFKAFFRRVKSGEKPGYPRFKAKGSYDSLAYKQAENGCVKLEHNRVSFSLLAKNVRLFQHRPVLGVIKTASVKRRTGKWFVAFSCDDVPPDPTLKAGTGEVGIDVGLTSFASLSTGEEIQNPRYGKKALARLKSAQRILSRRVRGSHRRRKQRAIVARQHEHVANQRRGHAFKTARGLVQRFGFIAVEDLEIRNMVKNRSLSRSISDASWGQFLGILECKALEAGTQVIRVNPKGTSQDCSGCGQVVPKTLSERLHHCAACGLIIGRDVNAAKNILAKARTAPPWRAAHERPAEAGSPAL